MVSLHVVDSIHKDFHNLLETSGWLHNTVEMEARLREHIEFYEGFLILSIYLKLTFARYEGYPKILTRGRKTNGLLRMEKQGLQNYHHQVGVEVLLV